MGSYIKILDKCFLSKTDIKTELRETEKSLGEMIALSKNMQGLSSEAIRLHTTFDEVCINLDGNITNSKNYIRAYKKYLNGDFCIIQCESCRQKIRIKYFKKKISLTCPSCRKQMTLSKDSFGKIHIKIDQKYNDQSKNNTSSNHPNTKESCFKVLSINTNSSLEDVKRAYRELIKKYHPDKVSHLGVEFQQLAEVKSKKINESFSYLIDHVF